MKSLSKWLKVIQKINPNEIDLGLDRVSAVEKKLNILSFSCPVILVGGTNGKGSCVETLSQIYSEAGYAVGSYTSPHLINFNERVRINCVPVSDNSLAQAFIKIEKVRDNIPLTFFEYTTLAALLIFKEAALDVLVLEIGLGGRLDAVNITEPDLSIVTNVDFDHQAWLGNDLESIAREKAGIMREGKPFIYGAKQLPKVILEKSKQLGVDLLQLNVNYKITEEETSCFWVHGEKCIKNLPKPAIHPNNAATSLMAIEQLQSLLPCDENAIKKGLLQGQPRGRLERIAHQCEILLDVSHNEQAVSYLAKSLSNKPILGKRYALCGMLTDKAIEKSLTPMLNLVNHWFLADLNIPRAASPETIQNNLKSLGVKVHYLNRTVAKTLAHMLSLVQPEDQIIVFGSFHTVGQAMHYLQQESVLLFH